MKWTSNLSFRVRKQRPARCMLTPATSSRTAVSQKSSQLTVLPQFPANQAFRVNLTIPCLQCCPSLIPSHNIGHSLVLSCRNYSKKMFMTPGHAKQPSRNSCCICTINAHEHIKRAHLMADPFSCFLLLVVAKLPFAGLLRFSSSFWRSWSIIIENLTFL